MAGKPLKILHNTLPLIRGDTLDKIKPVCPKCQFKHFPTVPCGVNAAAVPHNEASERGAETDEPPPEEPAFSTEF